MHLISTDFWLPRMNYESAMLNSKGIDSPRSAGLSSIEYTIPPFYHPRTYVAKIFTEIRGVVGMCLSSKNQNQV